MHAIRTATLWMTVILSLTCAGAAPAAAPAQVFPEQAAFIAQVAQSGLLNRQAAELALGSSTNQRTREFAQRMIDDQSRLDEQLSEVARRRDIALPAQPDSAHAAILNALGGKAGQSFDQAYARYLLEDRAALADLLLLNLLHPDTEIAVFSSYNMPLIQHHRRLAGQLNTAVAAGIRPAGPE